MGNIGGLLFWRTFNSSWHILYWQVYSVPHVYVLINIYLTVFTRHGRYINKAYILLHVIIYHNITSPTFYSICLLHHLFDPIYHVTPNWHSTCAPPFKQKRHTHFTNVLFVYNNNIFYSETVDNNNAIVNTEVKERDLNLRNLRLVHIPPCVCQCVSVTEASPEKLTNQSHSTHTLHTHNCPHSQTTHMSN